MNKKKVLVCGATGFVGRNIAEKLSERNDFELYGTYFHSEPYENSNINMVRADLRKEEEVQEVLRGIEVVVQAAATTSGAKDILERPHIHVTDNAVMNSLLLRGAFENEVKHFIFPSCSVMYQPSENPLKETDFDENLRIFQNYFGIGNTKVYVEKMCEFFSELRVTKHTVFRHSNVYGPHDKYDLEKSHVFGATMTKVLTNEDGKITVWGSGEEKRDLLYISDLVDFVEMSIDNNQEAPYKLYNVGSGEAISIKELVKKIIKSSGRNTGIEYDLTKPTIKTSLCLDTTKVRNELGWAPKISLDKGIEKTMRWYNQNIK